MVTMYKIGQSATIYLSSLLLEYGISSETRRQHAWVN